MSSVTVELRRSFHGRCWAYDGKRERFQAARCGKGSPFQVARGPLRISVTEGGSLQSLKSVTITSEVEGETKIAGIVPEGTVVTADDVAKGRVLIELDSSEIRNKLNRQEIAVSDAAAGVAQRTRMDRAAPGPRKTFVIAVPIIEPDPTVTVADGSAGMVTKV